MARTSTTFTISLPPEMAEKVKEYMEKRSRTEGTHKVWSDKGK